MRITWHVGDVIRKLRQNAGMNQSDLAKMISGKRTATISKIEQSGKCRLATLKEIANALGVTDADMLGMIPGKDPNIEASYAFACNNPKHTKLHILLEDILNGQREDADEWRNGIIANLRAMRLAALIGDTPPEGGHQRKSGPPEISHTPFPVEKNKKICGKK